MKILWRRIDLPGFEWCQILQGRSRALIQGLVLLNYKGKICKIDYAIECDPAWQTKSVIIGGSVGRRKVKLKLRVDPRKRWYLNGKHVEAVDGCVDVDLSFTPSTNLLPIRRLELRPGKAMEVTAAWVGFPSFRLRPLAQTYLQKNAQIVHYESAGGKFQRDLQINRKGVVIKYPGLWEAEAIE